MIRRSCCSATDKRTLPSFTRPRVTLRFVLRHTQSDERSDNAADGSAGTNAGQRSHDGASGYERSKTRNGEGADARQQAERTAEDAAGGSACGSTFGSFGIFLMREFLRAPVSRAVARRYR